MTELGKFLVEKRKEKSMSLDELQAITKIQKRYLQAVEEGNYHLLPGKFYARAFIKTYAEAIGIEPSYVFDNYSTDLPTTVEENAHEGLTRAKKKTDKTMADSKWLAILPKFLVIFLLLGLATSYWVYYQKFQTDPKEENTETDNNFADYENGELDDQPEDVPADQPEDVTDEPTNDPEEEINDEPQFTLTLTKSGKENFYYDLENTDKLNVQITFTGDCYVKIWNAKDHVFLKGTYKKEDVIEEDFSAEEVITIRLGATAMANILINGEPFTFASDANVQNIHINKK
jgi:cytoskeletal protein RodZ